VDLVTAGFSCQPFSAAGKRKGVDDERWIWPGIARVIRECRPRFVFLENVPPLTSGKPYLTVCVNCRINGGRRSAGVAYREHRCDTCRRVLRDRPAFVVLGAGIGAVLRDLASLGFDAEWGCLRASDLGAPHRRERIFILAYLHGSGRLVIGRQPEHDGLARR
jgi:DNA (cytosine-5)-methyltransferase 1